MCFPPCHHGGSSRYANVSSLYADAKATRQSVAYQTLEGVQAGVNAKDDQEQAVMRSVMLIFKSDKGRQRS